MIGTKIRGIRHLWRLSDSSLKKILVSIGGKESSICYVVKSLVDSQIGERLLIFNRAIDNVSYNSDSLEEYCGIKRDEFFAHLVSCNKIFEVSNLSRAQEYDRYFNDMILFPDDFDYAFKAFLNENSKMIKSICDKYCIDASSDVCKSIFLLTGNSKNFFLWAINLFLRENCSLSTIQSILTWNECYGQLTKKLKRGGTITAYTHLNSINDLLIELRGLRTEKRINDAINSFNTLQKKLLRSNNHTSVDKQTLARFSKLSEIKKNNFIKKVSTIDDYSELMKQMRHVTSTHFEWSKESFLDSINNIDGIDYEVIYDNGPIVLVYVKDYETIKYLAKTTNWCISKNKSYWNNYIENGHNNAKQYMVFDFSKMEDDKLSIIGFTVTKNKGITSAHNFINDNLMQVDANARMLKSYLSKFTNSNNIFKILDGCGIDINMITHYERPQYSWNYQGVMDYLFECVDKECVNIITNANNKMVISVRSEYIRYFLGDAYIDRVSNDYYGNEHILFIDFNKSMYDPERIVFAIISNENYDEDYCIMIDNISMNAQGLNFDTMLVEFGAPYDCIKRTDNVEKRIVDSFYSLNSVVLRKCLDENGKMFHKILKSKIDQGDSYDVIKDSIMGHLSFDLLDIIYDSGYSLQEYIGARRVDSLLSALFSTLRDCAARMGLKELEKPTDEEVDAFYNEMIDNRTKTFYIGMYIAIKKIIEHEGKDNEIFKSFVFRSFNNKIVGSMMKEFYYLIIRKIDFSRKCDLSSKIFLYLAQYGDEEMKETASSLMKKYPWLNKEVNLKEAISVRALSDVDIF